MNFPAITIVTAIIFLLTYAGISLGRSLGSGWIGPELRLPARR